LDIQEKAAMSRVAKPSHKSEKSCLDDPRESPPRKASSGDELPENGDCPDFRVTENGTVPLDARRIEWTIFAAACALALCLNVVLYFHSGSFWRDEASTLHVAAAPDVGTMWAWLPKDSAPVLSHGAIRLWIASGIGANDDGLRLFGTLVALGIIVSLYASCRLLVDGAPLLALALTVFNVAVFYYGSSLRGYGLAILFIMPCLAVFWKVAQRPTKWNVLASLLLGLLSCHVSYQNSFLLFAIGVAGAGSCAICRLWRRALLILAICSVVAASMLVYVPTLLVNRDCSEIQICDLRLSAIGTSLAEAVSGGNLALLCLWILLVFAGLAGLTAQSFSKRESASGGGNPSLAVYCLIAVVLADTIGMAFFRVYGRLPYPWHSTPLVAITAIVLEVAFQSWQKKAWVWNARVGAACIAIALSLPALWQAAHLRRTNLDCVASVVAEKASPDDFILVNGFWLPPSFLYHYHGQTKWNTVPLISTDREVMVAPYAAIKEKMAVQDAILPTLRKIKSTLASGHRLWIVDGIQSEPPSTFPPSLPPAPHSQYGWDNSVYAQTWSMQVDYWIRNHARKLRTIPVDAKDPVNGLENASLILVEGWKVH
jgi:hypothetical protein